MSTPDVSGFLLAHDAMRQELALLTVAARRPLSPAHADQLGARLADVLTLLDRHDREEDGWLWPTLRARVPQAAPSLDMLTVEHQQIAGTALRAGDPETPLPQRAGDIGELHEQLSVHLDHEERVALPLIFAQLSATEWAAAWQRMFAQIPRAIRPAVLGMIAGAAGPGGGGRVQQALRIAPFGARLVFRTVGRPVYQRRARRLYADLPPAAEAAPVQVR
jgi:hypothetical protein